MNDRTALSLVILPTYNEKDNISPLIEEILTVDSSLDVLIVDDASPDGTGQIADNLASESNRVHVMHRTGERGRGLAGIDGFKWAIKNKYDYVIEMDADFSHSPKDIPRFLDSLKTYHVVIGSRFVNEGKDLRTGFRPIFSNVSNNLCRLILNVKVKDCTSGFRAFRISSIQALNWDQMISKGPSIVEEVLYHLHTKSQTINEIPISFKERSKGHSKLSLLKTLFVLFSILKIRSSNK